MILNNTTKTQIKNISFEGYWFSLPVGVFACWDKFGEFLLREIYQVQGEGGSMPPVILGAVADWDGKKYADVSRFDLNGELIPSKKSLFKIAKQRGVSAEQMEEWEEDETIENKDIAQAINNLPVPEDIKYPEVATQTTKAPAAGDVNAEDTAQELINGPATTTPSAPTPAPKAPVTKKKAAKGKAAPKVPTTPAKAPKVPKTP